MRALRLIGRASLNLMLHNKNQAATFGASNGTWCPINESKGIKSYQVVFPVKKQ
ncbi:hypothetical protein Q4Q35_22085 [Flavivirga aquimarina]|uniref:Uncharacterized protein n=1 Tax=Flavivirga aquimarina TaxID=2027862 RepID=A0ABT8WHA7_9FLAO|nr:hypothetical protein [Flavivirga aquimarina]MDO5972500.1 hypothetical protein [Flavivirga aquimarina]